MSYPNQHEPVMVLNPNTGLWTDVRPLLDLALEFDDPKNKPSEVARELFRASRILIEYAPHDTDAFSELQYSFTCLNKIADGFLQVQEFDSNPNE